MATATTTATAPTATPTGNHFSKSAAIVAGISVPLAIVGIICLVMAYRMRKRLRAAWAGPAMGAGMPAVHDPEAQARAAREQKREVQRQLNLSMRRPKHGESGKRLEEGNGGYGIQVGGAKDYAMEMSSMASKETDDSRAPSGSSSNTMVAKQTPEVKEIAVHELSA